MEAKLVVVGGKAKKANVSLKIPTVIGRSKEAGLTIGHPMISRRHCEVVEAGGLLLVRDLGSLNGTLVAGRRIKESPLPPNAEFTIGPLTFRAEYEYAGDLAKMPAPVFAEQDATAPSVSSKDEEVFDVKGEAPLASPTIVGAGSTTADSAFFEEMVAPSGNGAAASKLETKPLAAPATDADDDVDFFALVEEEQAAPKPKKVEAAPKQANSNTTAAQPAAAKKTPAKAEPKAKPAKEAPAGVAKPSSPAPAKKAPAKQPAAKPKAAVANDPSELPDDLFDDLLNDLD